MYEPSKVTESRYTRNHNTAHERRGAAVGLDSPFQDPTLKKLPFSYVSYDKKHTCSSAVGGYSPGLREGLAAATGAPFDGTSEAIPAAADTGLAEAAGPRDDSAPPLVAAVLFTSVLVPTRVSHRVERYRDTSEGLERRTINNNGQCTGTIWEYWRAIVSHTTPVTQLRYYCCCFVYTCHESLEGEGLRAPTASGEGAQRSHTRTTPLRLDFPKLCQNLYSRQARKASTSKRTILISYTICYSI